MYPWAVMTHSFFKSGARRSTRHDIYFRQENETFRPDVLRVKPNHISAFRKLKSLAPRLHIIRK